MSSTHGPSFPTDPSRQDQAWQRANSPSLPSHRESNPTPSGHSEVTARSALWSLEAIRGSKPASFDADILAALKAGGIVETMRRADHASFAALAAGLGGAEKLVAVRETALDDLRQRLDTLERNVGSLWYGFRTLSWLGSGVVAKDREELAERRLELTGAEERHGAAVKDRDTRRTAAQAILRFVDGGEEFVRLKPKGEQLLNRLEARSEILGRATLTQFESAMSDLWTALDGRVARVNGIKSALQKRGFSGTDSDTIDYAVTLLGAPGTPEEAVARGEAVAKHLSAKGFTRATRYKIAGAAAAKEGSVEEIVRDLDSTFTHLVSKGHSGSTTKGYVTYALASMLASVPGATHDDRFARFEAVESKVKALTRTSGWESARLAAHLSRIDGPPDAVTKRLADMERMMRTLAIWSDKDGHTIAGRLSVANGSVEERTKRFAEALTALGEQGFDTWDTQTRSAAAVLSVLPGTLDANAQTVRELKDRMSTAGYGSKHALPLAMATLSGGMRDMLVELTENREKSRAAGVDSGHAERNRVADDGMDDMIPFIILWGGAGPDTHDHAPHDPDADAQAFDAGDPDGLAMASFDGLSDVVSDALSFDIAADVGGFDGGGGADASPCGGGGCSSGCSSGCGGGGCGGGCGS